MRGIRFGVGKTARLSIDATALIALLALFGAIVFGLFHENLLPGKYFYDGHHIARLMASGVTFGGFDESFKNTAALFAELGFSAISLSVVGALVAFVAMVSAIYRSGVRVVPSGMALMSGIWLIILYVYIGQPSKELLVLGLALVFLLVARNRVGLVLWLVPVALYTLYFRGYWAILVVLFVGTYIVDRWLTSAARWVLYGVMAYGALAVLFQMALGQSLTFARGAVNVGRLGSPDAITLIVNYVPGSGFITSWANAIVSTLFLAFPLPLALIGIKYVAFALIIALMFYFSFRSAKYLRMRGAHNFQTRAAARFFYVFLLTQGLFEPDYGSFIRHVSPILPMIVLLWGRAADVKRYERLKQIAAQPPAVSPAC